MLSFIINEGNIMKGQRHVNIILSTKNSKIKPSHKQIQNENTEHDIVTSGESWINTD